MTIHQKVLFVDASSGFYRVARYPLGDFFGPVDLGLHLAGKFNSLNLGVGLLAGSILPGSNRLIVSGFSTCWGGFYVSTMGGAGLVFDNLGINMVSLVGRALTPSILYLNRTHGEEIEVRLEAVDIRQVWLLESRSGRPARFTSTWAAGSAGVGCRRWVGAFSWCCSWRPGSRSGALQCAARHDLGLRGLVALAEAASRPRMGRKCVGVAAGCSPGRCRHDRERSQ